MEELESRDSGAIVVFSGRVRPDRTAAGRVVALEYEAQLVAGIGIEEIQRLKRQLRHLQHAAETLRRARAQ